MAKYKITLSTGPQKFLIQLISTTYQFVLIWRDTDQGGWYLDINDTAGNAIVNGIPLLPGSDLLAQYQYLGIGGSLYVLTDGNPLAAPTFDSLGVTTWLYFETTS